MRIAENAGYANFGERDDEVRRISPLHTWVNKGKKWKGRGYRVLGASPMWATYGLTL
jgi:hypothetical protein